MEQKFLSARHGALRLLVILLYLFADVEECVRPSSYCCLCYILLYGGGHCPIGSHQSISNYSTEPFPPYCKVEAVASKVETSHCSPSFQLTLPLSTRAMIPTVKLNFITSNKNKLAEVKAILGNVVEIDSQAIEVPEIQGSIEEIAKEKARRAAEEV